ncbi:GNAT family N-acetyltransferase [Xanthomonas sacchari]|uniref:GNAT family N-acetyltransferase n=1 Tax=Xanthomonas sacchari TaxID=56458 RepID=UPI000262A869|nr:GNAT family N-acetyltransferase [Xanthomonas sacchari]MDV0438696.1 GNAT family N-acetyltransferase [Xanthomonas sacchari]
MSMPIRVRAFAPADADALATLFHASVRQAGIGDYSAEQVAAWSPSRPDPGTYLRRAVHRTILVAVDATGVVVGYGDLEPDGHIDHLYCHPERVGTGIGSGICAELEAVAQKTGIAVLSVEASEGARRLFARRGFALDSRNAFFFNGVMLHNYRMSKRIA